MLQSIHLHLSDEKIAGLAASLLFMSPRKKTPIHRVSLPAVDAGNLSQSMLSQSMHVPFNYPAKSNYRTVFKLFTLEISSVVVEVISENLLSPLVTVNILGAKAEFQERPYDRSGVFIVSEFSIVDCTQTAESSSRFLASTRRVDESSSEDAFVRVSIAQFVQVPPKLVRSLANRFSQFRADEILFSGRSTLPWAVSQC